MKKLDEYTNEVQHVVGRIRGGGVRPKIAAQIETYRDRFRESVWRCTGNERGNGH